MRIDVHIERLVLDGLPVTSAEGTRIREAVESELLKLLAAGQLSGEFARGGARPLVNAPQITFDPRERPAGVGSVVARSVYAAIGMNSAIRPRSPSSYQ
jgi:hypothetical protein